MPVVRNNQKTSKYISRDFLHWLTSNADFKILIKLTYVQYRSASLPFITQFLRVVICQMTNDQQIQMLYLLLAFIYTANLLYLIFFINQFNNSQQMTNIFAYGSLMYPEVIQKLLTQKKYESCRGTLKDFVRLQVKQQVYPGVKKQEGGSVEGVLYFGLTEADVKILHEFQRDEYIATKVEVITQKSSFEALVYEYKDYNALSEQQWNIAYFQEKEKAGFATKHVQQYRQP